LRSYLIDDRADSNSNLSRISKDSGLVREELFEEDLELRKKLDDLEAGLARIDKEIKPTLLVMEKELSLITEEVK